MKRFLIISCLLFLFLGKVVAQVNNTDPRLKKVFKLDYTPSVFDSYSYQILYLSDGKIYNLRNFCLADRIKHIHQLAIQPGGSSCALLISPAKQTSGKTGSFFAKLNNLGGNQRARVEIYSANNTNECLYKIKEEKDAAKQPVCIGYSPDGKNFVIADSGNEIVLYDTRTYTPYLTLNTALTVSCMAVSPNNYFLAVAEAGKIEVWNFHEAVLRTQLNIGSRVNDLAFSEDNTMMAVVAANGTATVYDTRSFTPLFTYSGMGEALSCKFYPNNKYLGVVKNSGTLVMLNLKNEADQTVVKSYNGGLNTLRYIEDLRDPEKIYLVYTSGKSFVLQQLTDLKHNFTQELSGKVKEKMNEWMKMLEGETLEEYKIRVNEDSRVEQQAIFEREIATEMAGDQIKMTEISLGNYNTSKNMLALDFSTMPSIVLEVEKEEIKNFNPQALQFQNTVYGINKDDEFEIIYTEVLNTQTNKTYIYDNLDRMSVVSMDLEEGFVPLDLIEQSNMEEVRLKEIRQHVMEEAKKSKLISDNTKINVSTEVLSDVDANGKKIINYKIGYQYEVAKEYTAQEDFPMGKYKTEASNAALSMLSIISKAFETDFAQYIKPGKQIKIKITGTADAAPINGKIAYGGCYGDFRNELVYKNGKLGNITITSESGITENEQLAFLRAAGVQDYIVSHLTALRNMKCDYDYNIIVAEQTGGEFRRIRVEFLFIDTF